MPFTKREASEKSFVREDIDIICKLLEEVKPHQVFAAGDLSDPHGTHRVSMSI